MNIILISTSVVKIQKIYRGFIIRNSILLIQPSQNQHKKWRKKQRACQPKIKFLFINSLTLPKFEGNQELGLGFIFESNAATETLLETYHVF